MFFWGVQSADYEYAQTSTDLPFLAYYISLQVAGRLMAGYREKRQRLPEKTNKYKGHTLITAAPQSILIYKTHDFFRQSGQFSKLHYDSLFLT
jgi:hypothetical protein